MLCVLMVSFFPRGSLGFGEEALQSLPGKVGSQVWITLSDKIFFLGDNILIIFCSKCLSYLKH